MHKYYVVSSEHLTASTLLLTLEHEKESAPTFSFSPGQYAAISFVRNGRPSVARCFSIVSSPTRMTQLQFSMRVRGRFTTALTQLVVGDEVIVRGPYGGFVFDPSRHSDSVFVAGGIGITPFMSMVEFAAVTGCTRAITLLYGVQTQDDAPFVEQLRSFRTQNPHFSVVLAVDHGPVDALADFTVVEGRITPEVLLQAVGKTDKTVFICGPPPFMNGMVKTLKSEGVSKERIITEAFNQGSHRQTGKVVSWPRNSYVMGALGFSVGSIALLVWDIVKTLPSLPLMDQEQVNSPLMAQGEREKMLDELMNELPTHLPSGKKSSPTLVKAQNKAKEQSSATSAQASSSSTSQAPTVTTPVKPVAPVVTQPKCTTSQSGVTTCT